MKLVVGMHMTSSMPPMPETTVMDVYTSVSAVTDSVVPAYLTSTA